MTPKKKVQKSKKKTATALPAFQVMLEEGSNLKRLVDGLESDIKQDSQTLAWLLRHWAGDFNRAADRLEKEDIARALMDFGANGPELGRTVFLIATLKENVMMHKRLMISLGLRKEADEHDWYSGR